MTYFDHFDNSFIFAIYKNKTMHISSCLIYSLFGNPLKHWLRILNLCFIVNNQCTFLASLARIFVTLPTKISFEMTSNERILIEIHDMVILCTPKNKLERIYSFDSRNNIRTYMVRNKQRFPVQIFMFAHEYVWIHL